MLRIQNVDIFTVDALNIVYAYGIRYSDKRLKFQKYLIHYIEMM